MINTRHLRSILGGRRRPGESWVSFIKRQNAYLIAALHRYKIKRLAERLFERTFARAHRILHAEPLPGSIKPAELLLRWKDEESWRRDQVNGLVLDAAQTDLQWRHSRPGRMNLWEDPFWTIFGLEWKDTLFDGGSYQVLRKRFVHRCADLYCKVLQGKFTHKLLSDKYVAKAEDDDDEAADPGDALDWGQDVGPRIELVGDSSLVVDWINGAAQVKSQQVAKWITGAVRTIHDLVSSGVATFRNLLALPARHVKRKWNTIADQLANDVLDGKYSPTLPCSTYALAQFRHFRLLFDGASRGNPGPSSAGWAVLGRTGTHAPWVTLHQGANKLGYTTSVQAECQACSLGLSALQRLLMRRLQFSEVSGI